VLLKISQRYLGKMGIIKKILLLTFGFFAGLIGFVSFALSISMITMHFFNDETTDQKTMMSRIFMFIMLLIFAELFLAFGIAAMLLGLHCALGPKVWIIKMINFFWSRAIKTAMIFFIVLWSFVAIAWMIKILFHL
jgi:hypothetical protein